MRFLSVFVAIVIVLVLAKNVSAQTTDQTSSSASPTPTNVVKGKIRQSIAQPIDIMKRAGNALQSQADFVRSIEEKRQQAIEKYRTQKERFQTRLQEIVDDKKRAIVERISLQIEERNKKFIDRMIGVLDKLQSILDEFKKEIDNLASGGSDTKEVEQEVARVQKTIDAAKAAVTNQASKMYVITLPTGDQGLKGSVGRIVSQFRTDLRIVHKIMIDAKQAVQKINPALNKVKTGSQSEITPTVVVSQPPLE